MIVGVGIAHAVPVTAPGAARSNERNDLIVLLTGASGFIGRHLVQALAAHGHDLIVTSRRPGRHPQPGLEHRVVAPLLFVGCGPRKPRKRPQWALRDLAPALIEHFAAVPAGARR